VITSLLRDAVREIGAEIPDARLEELERFAVELKKWNRTINLTALSCDEDIAIKHLLDSIIVSRTMQGGSRLLDIGSGAGVPAIPLKILLPQLQIVSVDAVGKKISFQRHIARLLGLQGFEAVHTRVESMQRTHAGYFDVIVSRAFSRLDMFVTLAAPLLSDGGKIIAMKGPAAEEEISDISGCLKDRKLVISDVQSYSLPKNKGERRLVIVTAAQAP
jgi:16S rRNA (guanine527-N7)-methyltransferase